MNPARSAKARARVDFPVPGRPARSTRQGLLAWLLQLGEGEEPEGTGLGLGRGPLGFGDLALRELHALHLAAHRGAVGPVERQQRAALLVARGAKIRLDERPGEIAAALERQLHGEEGDVGDRVGVAEPLVELDAVHHDPVARRMPLREPVDVIEPEVAVGVAGNASEGPVLDDVAEIGQGCLGPQLRADRASIG